jgi:SAM-dependent methyltransferase
MEVARVLGPDQDAFGLMLRDYLGSTDAVAIVERDDGYVDCDFGGETYFAPFTDWSPHVQAAMRHLRGPVLDIGCGAGRVCLYAQEQGLDALGTDISPLAIETCRLRGVRRAEAVAISELSPALGRFATVVMCGNNWGLMGTPGRARWLLRRFRQLTTPDAVILAESCNPYATANPDHLDYHARNRARGRMAGQLRLRVRYRRACTPWFDYLFVSPDEMRELVAGTGWQVRELFGSPGPLYAAAIERVR